MTSGRAAQSAGNFVANGPKPQVSVLLPCYNVARSLAQAIDSVIAQDMQAWELIAVDDGSTDHTGQILDSYALREPRIRVIHQAHEGISRALNEAIASARGQFTARMDAHDVAQPQCLSKQIAYLQAHVKSAAVSSGAALTDENGRIIDRGNSTGARRRFPFGLTATLPWHNHPSVVVRTELLRRVGGYDSAFDGAEDFDLWFRLLQHGPVDVYPENLFENRLLRDGPSCIGSVQLHIGPAVRVLQKYRNKFLSAIDGLKPTHTCRCLFSAPELEAMVLLRRSSSPVVLAAGGQLDAAELRRLKTVLQVIADPQPCFQDNRVVIASPLSQMLTKLLVNESKFAMSGTRAVARAFSAGIAGGWVRLVMGRAASALREPKRFKTFRRHGIASVKSSGPPEVAARLAEHAFDTTTQNTKASFVQQTFHYLPHLNLFYGECSKNGCTSLKAHLGVLELGNNAILQARFGSTSFHWKRQSPFLGINELGQGLLSGLLSEPSVYRFCMVRNPYARVFSAYNDKILGLKHQRPASFREYSKVCVKMAAELGRPLQLNGTQTEVPISFGDFLEYLRRTAHKPFDRHWHPQWKTVRPDVIAYDQIGHVERFEHEFVKLMINLGVHEKYWLIHLLQQNRRAASDWRDQYDEARAALVYQLYEQDFETFGYSRESWRK